MGEAGNAGDRAWSASLPAYFRAVGWWWIAVIATLGNAAWLATDPFGWSIPHWVWGAIAVAALLVAPFIAFHKLRLAHLDASDELRDEHAEALAAKDAAYAALKTDAKNKLIEANRRLREAAAQMDALRTRVTALESDADPVRIALEKLDAVTIQGATDTPRMMFLKAYRGIEEPTFLLNTAALFVFGDTGRIPVLRVAGFIKALRNIGLVATPHGSAFIAADSAFSGLLMDERYWTEFVRPLADKVADTIVADEKSAAIKLLHMWQIRQTGSEYEHTTALELFKKLGPWMRTDWWPEQALGVAILEVPGGALPGTHFGGGMAARLLKGLQQAALLDSETRPNATFKAKGGGGYGGAGGYSLGTPQEVYKLSDWGWAVYQAATAPQAAKAAP